MMVQIEFSSIGSLPAETAAAVKQFEKDTGITVRVRVMQWEYAWPELLSYALHGNGPDLSHVGSTWVSSLVKMNVLRPFKPAEMPAGGAGAFLPACWNSVMMPDDKTIWALPWTAYTFLICYRRDLLQHAGVEPAEAFKSAEAFTAAVRQMSQARMYLPLIIPTSKPLVDIIHMAASWIWGAGGDFITEDGKAPAFTQPNALAGLRLYYELGEFIPPLARNLDVDQIQAIFRQGEAAMTICGIEEPYDILRTESVRPVVRENLGVAAMPGQPWVGGDNLVIWQHVQDDPRREQAAVALSQYLVSPEVQKKVCHSEMFTAPTRVEVLPDMPFPGSEITAQVERSLREGRSYRPIALWGRVETQLSAALNLVWFDILKGIPIGKAIQDQLDPVADKLKAALGN
jgi:multiple sugar transport system substrate-binding protein